MNELATNAVKYGALGTPAGTVDVRWEVEQNNPGPHLRLTWVERGGPPVSASHKAGFGSFLIEHGLPEVHIEREFRPEGVACTIELPLTADKTAPGAS